MKAVTLRQPWAWAASSGYMPLLNRHDGGALYGSRYVAIHASDESHNEEDLEFLRMRIGVDRVPSRFVKSSIVGLVTVERIMHEGEEMPVWYKQWWSDEFPLGWVLRNAVAFEPLKCIHDGEGLWELPTQVRDVALGLYRKENSRRLLNKFRNKRKERRITQEQMGILCGYSKRQIINIEKHGTDAVSKVLMMMDVIGLSIEDFT